MCSNYTPSKREALIARFGVQPPDNAFEAEAYPSYLAPIVRLSPDGRDEKECVPACFGLVPHWADLKLAKHTYNARTETVASKPSFRHAWRQRQFCIVPAESFFEPSYESGKAERWKIHHAQDEPLGIAGIWEYRAAGPDGMPLISFSMLTINADEHPLMSRFHKPDDEKRMLVILRPDEYDSWLQAPLEQAPSFFMPFPAEELAAEAAPRPTKSRPARPEPRRKAAASRDAPGSMDSLF